MISIRIIEELEKLGFGCDIDKLESYVNSLNCVEYLKYYSEAEHKKWFKCKELLKEIKSDSVCIKQLGNEVYKLESHDISLYDNPTKIFKRVDNVNEAKENFLGLLDYEDTEIIDIIAMEHILGIDIRVVYEYGILKDSSIISSKQKGRRTLKAIYELLPNKIDNWFEYSIVEIRGKLTVNYNTQEVISNTIKSLEKAVDELQFMAYRCLIFEDNQNICSSIFEELYNLHIQGMTIPKFNRYKEVELYNIDNTIHKIIKDMDISKESLHSKTDSVLILIDNHDLLNSLNNEENYEYTGGLVLNIIEEKTYTSTIIDINLDSEEYIQFIIKIVPIDTNKGVVDTIKTTDINTIDDKQLWIGNSIKFKIDKLEDIIIL